MARAGQAEDGIPSKPPADLTRAAMLSRASMHSAGYATIFDSFPFGTMMIYDTDLRYLLAGGHGFEAAGMQSQLLEGHTIWEIWSPETAAVLEPLYRAALIGHSCNVDILVGERIYQVRISPLETADAPITAGLVYATDVTDERRRESSLAESEHRFRLAFDNAPTGMALIALDGLFLRVNAALSEMLGHPVDRLLTMRLADITVDDVPGEELSALEHVLAGDAARCLVEKRYLRADGTVGWALMARSLVRGPEGEALHFLAHAQDVTDRRNELLELERLAASDPLTGVLNRRRFNEELDRYKRLVTRYGEEGAVLLIDLDGLKRVNDLQGHLAGDAFIREAAAAICGRVRATDVVARLGGDEFGVLLPHVDSVHALQVGASLAADIAACATHGTASVGVAMITGSADVDLALDAADAAMYRAKRAGGNRVAASAG